MPGPRPVPTIAAAALLILGAACARRPPPLTFPPGPPPGLDEPAWPAAAEQHGGAPIVEGNAVQVLVNGREIFPAMLGAIRSARRSVTYAQFSYKEGAISARLADTLAERCRDGVRVHVLIDGWGARWMPDHYVAGLRRAGCQVRDDFRPLRPGGLGRANFRNHRKLLVVDGRVGFTGGSVVAPGFEGDADAPDRWRETDVRVEGPIVRHLQAAFAAQWLEATGARLQGDDYYPPLAPRGPVAAQVVASAPVDHDLSVYRLFRFVIASARRSIWVTNQYLLLDDGMAGALAAAARRGVDVALIVPGRPTNGLVHAAGQRGLGRLLEAGVEIYAYQASHLHAKTMVVDGRWATIGSANLDPRSLFLNDELNLALYDRGVAAELETLFARDLARARRVTPAGWAGRPISVRLLGWLLAPVWSQL